MIQRKISHGVQSRQGPIRRSRLLTVTTSLRQQDRDAWEFLEHAWIAHHYGGVMPSLLPDPLVQYQQQQSFFARSAMSNQACIGATVPPTLNECHEIIPAFAATVVIL